MLALYDRRHGMVAQLRENGVDVFVGTDAGSAMPHGLVLDEVDELLSAGFTPSQALDAGCWAARAWLGQPGLVEGADADLISSHGRTHD